MNKKERISLKMPLPIVSFWELKPRITILFGSLPS